MAPPNSISCATCGCETDFFTAPVGPFCSTRCQMIDLGRWFAEDYRISEPLSAAEFLELENSEED